MSTATPLKITPPGSVLPDIERAMLQPVVDEIERLKVERNAIVAAHNYMTPDIFELVADIKGDSLYLAEVARDTEADVIVLAGVNFMADTAKLVNPAKTVLLPSLEAGCSLADGITGEDVRRLKAQYPGVPVVTYVNTSAEVKAETDICCTSGNAVAVVESLGVDRVLFLPDQYLGKYVATKTDVELILWDGACMVHERFTGEEMRRHREGLGNLPIIAHPECPPDVLAEADYVGSTNGIINWVAEHKPERVMMVTECSMADNVALSNPDTEFIRPCNLCPHMKQITLDGIRNSLATMTHQVEIPVDVAARARVAVERMLAVGRNEA